MAWLIKILITYLEDQLLISAAKSPKYDGYERRLA